MSRYFFIFCWILPVLAYSVEPHQDFIRLAKKARHSVVNISVAKEGSNNVIPFYQGYYLMPFSPPEIKGSGSGFIVDKAGLIVTNAHVVQNFDKIQIQFAEEEKLYPAKILGLDRQSDIALLKVSTNKKLVPIQMGDSERLEVGEWVAAIGNPHGYGHTMTKGIISAVKREIDDLNLFPLLQTDASINPGNSGGPLVNLKGEVVGVNQAIARGAMGISFAIPINNVREVLKDLKSFGFVRRAFIGVEFFSDGKDGALIVNVYLASPAEKAGLKIKDRIIEFAGNKITNPKDLPKAIRRATAGKTVSLKAVREGRTIQLKITPQMWDKHSFSAERKNPQQRKSKIKGQVLPGGFKALEGTKSHLSRFGLPTWAGRYPIISYIHKGSLASKSDLRAGDLIFQINGYPTHTIPQAKKAFRKGKNQINILRYYQKYDKYFSISTSFTL